MLTKKLRDAFRFFYEHSGYVVGARAIGAIDLARAEARAEEAGVRFDWEDEFIPWEGDCPEPDWDEFSHLWCNAVLPCPCCGGDGESTSLGSIVLRRGGDTYARVIEAELALELGV